MVIRKFEKVTVKVLPWQPRAKFTGISRYTLSEQGKVIKQEDFWDSVNLKSGKYQAESLTAGLSDFLAELKQEAGAEMAAPELPVSVHPFLHLYSMFFVYDTSCFISAFFCCC
jgi:hypothetical protein